MLEAPNPQTELLQMRSSMTSGNLEQFARPSFPGHWPTYHYRFTCRVPCSACTLDDAKIFLHLHLSMKILVVILIGVAKQLDSHSELCHSFLLFASRLPRGPQVSPCAFSPSLAVRSGQLFELLLRSPCQFPRASFRV
jgi:hypothetical protein